VQELGGSWVILHIRTGNKCYVTPILRATIVLEDTQSTTRGVCSQQQHAALCILYNSGLQEANLDSSRTFATETKSFICKCSIDQPPIFERGHRAARSAFGTALALPLLIYYWKPSWRRDSSPRTRTSDLLDGDTQVIDLPLLITDPAHKRTHASSQASSVASINGAVYLQAWLAHRHATEGLE